MKEFNPISIANDLQAGKEVSLFGTDVDIVVSYSEAGRLHICCRVCCITANFMLIWTDFADRFSEFVNNHIHPRV